MKQSAVKTLGVAALGAAFAATGAGAASAAAGPDAVGVLGTVASTLPLEETAQSLPDGAPEALAAGHSALQSGLKSAQPTTDKLLPLGDGAADRALATKAAPKPADPVKGLLGGVPVAQGLGTNALPTDTVTGALPTNALPTSALPTQGLPLGSLPVQGLPLG
ncbi:ATP-binding protein [Streptomyces flavofungini]|uniref:ATP-binding protein n=1 Tax=Streptomyces flavofungini TaxID=68200 RepID=UPI0025B189EF|nr:ATP-binding protein [Streptomyces flavofungini]WJV46586.1 ATP-binding protein [Streptomyces flavofungini]